MDVQLGRRELLKAAAIGGPSSAPAPWPACAKADSGATGASGGPLPTSTIGSSEVAPLQLFASTGLQRRGTVRTRWASSQVSEVGEMMRIAQTINSRTGNPADPGTDAFNAYFDVFGQWGDQLQQLADQAGTVSPHHPQQPVDAGGNVLDSAALLRPRHEQRIAREQAYQVTQDRWAAAIKTFTLHGQAGPGSIRGPLPVFFFPARGSGKKPTVIISFRQRRAERRVDAVWRDPGLGAVTTSRCTKARADGFAVQARHPFHAGLEQGRCARLVMGQATARGRQGRAHWGFLWWHVVRERGGQSQWT